MLARAAVRGDDLSRIGISLAEHRRSQERVDNILSQVRDVAGLLDPLWRYVAPDGVRPATASIRSTATRIT